MASEKRISACERLAIAGIEMPAARYRLEYHSVDLTGAQVCIAILQLTGPGEGEKEPEVKGGRPILCWREGIAEQRAHRIARLIESLATRTPKPAIVVCPEYSVPLTPSTLARLRTLADKTGIIIVPGSDNDTPSGRREEPNIAEAVVIPPGREPIFVEKRTLSLPEEEQGAVNLPRAPKVHAFRWKAGSRRFWFTVQVCKDFLSFSEHPPSGLRRSSGLVLVPMCSHNWSQFQTHADALRGTLDKGVATVLCCATGERWCGRSGVILTTARGPQAEGEYVAASLPPDSEGCVITTLNLDCLTIPVGKSHTTRSPLGITSYFDVVGARIVPLEHRAFSGRGVLNRHNDTLIHEFSTARWPYDLNQSRFVRAVRYSVGDLQTREELRGGRNCLRYLEEQLRRRSLVIVGHYGMGKTTLLRMLFTEMHQRGRRIVPFYIHLSGTSLADVGVDRLAATISRTATSKLSSPSGRPTLKGLQLTVEGLLESGQLVVLLDGIDEAIIENRPQLHAFLRQLSESGVRYAATVRLEFRPFFDLGAQAIVSGHPRIIELLPWGRPQWRAYLMAMERSGRVPGRLLARFSKRLFDERYGTLPRRPLFLRMLADLEVRNRTEVNIDKRLADNLSEVYFKFISWKVMDDYRHSGGALRFDKERFLQEAVELLAVLAELQYRHERAGEPSSFTLPEANAAIQSSAFSVLRDSIREAFLEWSLFSILHRVSSSTFEFSHKSFMEYLVAHQFASTVFFVPGDAAKATCSGIWDSYQTHEVSQHFLKEIERIRVSEGLSEGQVLEHFRHAFSVVLGAGALTTPGTRDERIQSALYYAGKLGLHDRVIEQKLHQIVSEPSSHDRLYVRTAAISLGDLGDPRYVDNYSIDLLKGRTERNSNFAFNLELSKEYYGVPDIEKVLRDDLSAFLAGGKPSAIISLKLVTYCAYVEQTNPSALRSLRSVVRDVQARARLRHYDGLYEVCRLILENWL